MSPSRGPRYVPGGWRDEDEAYRAGSSSSSSYIAPPQRGQEYGHATQSYYQDYDQYRGSATYNSQPAPGYEHDTWGRDYEHRSSSYADYRAAEYQAYLGTFGHARGQEHGQQGYAYPQESTSWSEYDSYRRYPSAYPASSYSGYSEYRAPANDCTPTNGRHYDPNSGSYSDYRRTDHHHSREMHARRSASPPSGHEAQTRGYGSQARPKLTKPFLLSSSSHPKASSPPAPPRRTEPTDEYLSISMQPSTLITDPAQVRKLVVLDLNGSLLLRSPHQRRAPLPRYGGRTDALYAPDPTQPRPLRMVHRRPYLGAFTAYILHEKTKTWLDVMVWSSAQPHSVDDMVDRSFGERRSELKAIWARDTLGLSGDDYHKKSLTIKDLAKPWAELPIQGSSTLDTVTSSPPKPEIESSTVPTAEASEPQRHHSALTTLLVDDSPLKAMLQPWNHLCIREYVQKMRNLDLATAAWEAARERMGETREEFAAVMNGSADKPGVAEKEETMQAAGVDEVPLATNPKQPDATKAQDELPPALDQDVAKATEEQEAVNADDDAVPPVKRVVHEVVMVDGEMKNTEEVVHRVFREVVMIRGELVAPPASDADAEPSVPQAPFIPNQKRKIKKLAKRERERQEREKKERAAFEALHQEQEELAAARLNNPPVEAASAAPADGGESAPSPAPVEEKAPGPEPRYDETLLAVIGILDHVKHEGNIAGWMRSGGLVQTVLASSEASKEDVGSNSPAPQAHVEAHAGMKHSPPSRGASPSEASGPTKRRRVDHDAEVDTATQKSGVDDIPPPSSPATEPPASQTLPSSPISEAQALTGVPLSSSLPHSPTHSRTHKTADTAAKVSSNPSPGTAPASNLWFENPAVLLYWANHGRNALNGLGIAIDSGVDLN